MEELLGPSKGIGLKILLNTNNRLCIIDQAETQKIDICKYQSPVDQEQRQEQNPQCNL